MEPWTDAQLEEALRGLRRPSLAGHDVTHEFLEAGRDLLGEALSAGSAGNDAHPFMRWMSRQTVIDAVTARGRIRGTEGYFRDRWDRHGDYVSDLLAWIRLQRPSNSFPARAGDLIAAALASAASPSQVVRGLSRRNMLGLFDNAMFRFQLVSLAVVGSRKASSGEEVRDEARDLYDEIDSRWTIVFQQFLDKYGFDLRSGIELQDLVDLMVAVGEGLALRELACPTDGHERERRAALQGVAAMALLLGCVGTDGLTVDEALDRHLARD